MISAILWVEIRQYTSFQAQMPRKRARNTHLLVAIRKNQHYILTTKKTVLLVKIKMSAKPHQKITPTASPQTLTPPSDKSCT